MKKAALKELMLERAACLQHMDATADGIEYVNDAHHDVVVDLEQMIGSLESFLRTLPKNASVNRMLVKDAISSSRRAYSNLIAVRRKQRRGDEKIEYKKG